MLFGGLIGFERQLSGKPAGLRTNMLISLGSTLVMILSIHLNTLDIHSNSADKRIVSDPARLAAQVISGIGFLGAGVIMQTRGSKNQHISGLTTAATIWTVAMIGLSVGAGFFFLSSISTIFVIFILYIMRVIEQRLRNYQSHSRILWLTMLEINKIDYIKKILYRFKIEIKTESISKSVDDFEYKVLIQLTRQKENKLVSIFMKDPEIVQMRFSDHHSH